MGSYGRKGRSEGVGSSRRNRRFNLGLAVLVLQNSAEQTLCHPRLRFLDPWLWSSVRLTLATNVSNREAICLNLKYVLELLCYEPF
jgi:hypothetical protein